MLDLDIQGYNLLLRGGDRNGFLSPRKVCVPFRKNGVCGVLQPNQCVAAKCVLFQKRFVCLLKK